MRPLALLLLVLALLAGCGDDGGDGGASETGGTKGTGYTLDPPEGWSDGTEEAKTGAVNFDLVLLGERRDDFTSNVNILREQPQGGGLDVDDLADVYGPQLLSLGATDLKRGDDIEIDGETALVHDYRIGQQGEKRRGRQAAVVRGDHLYTITLTTSEESFEQDARDFQAMLSSWRWSG